MEFQQQTRTKSARSSRGSRGSDDFPEDKEVYIIITFEGSHQRTFQNCMVRNKSILHNYRGTYVAMSKGVQEVIPGRWPRGHYAAILHFPSREEALRWFHSDTEIRQPDWLGGAEMMLVPLKECTPKNKKFFHITCFDTSRHSSWLCGQFAKSLEDCVNENNGAKHTVCACPYSGSELRGYMGSGALCVVNQFNSHSDFKNFVSTEKYKQLKMDQEDRVPTLFEIIFEG